MSVVMAVNNWYCWQKRGSKKGGSGGQYISFYRPPLGPTLGQQNLDRRRFDLLGNRETPTHQCVFHMESTCNDNNIAKYLFYNMKYQNPQEISKKIVPCTSFTSKLLELLELPLYYTLYPYTIGYSVSDSTSQHC